MFNNPISTLKRYFNIKTSYTIEDKSKKKYAKLRTKKINQSSLKPQLALNSVPTKKKFNTEKKQVYL